MVRLAPLNMFKPSSDFILLTVPRRCFFCGSFCVIYVSRFVFTVPCSLVITGWERADLLALPLVFDISLCFVSFPYGGSGQVWYLIVSIPDLCLLLYFYTRCKCACLIKAWALSDSLHP